MSNWSLFCHNYTLTAAEENLAQCIPYDCNAFGDSVNNLGGTIWPLLDANLEIDYPADGQMLSQGIGGVLGNPPAFAAPMIMGNAAHWGDVNGFFKAGTKPLEATALPVSDANMADVCLEGGSPVYGLFFETPQTGGWFIKSQPTTAASFGATNYNIGGVLVLVMQYEKRYTFISPVQPDNNIESAAIKISSTTIRKTSNFSGFKDYAWTTPSTAWVHVEYEVVYGENEFAEPTWPSYKRPYTETWKIWVNGILAVDDSFSGEQVFLAEDDNWMLDPAASWVSIFNDHNHSVLAYAIGPTGTFDDLKLAWDRNKTTYTLPVECFPFPQCQPYDCHAFCDEVYALGGTCWPLLDPNIDPDYPTDRVLIAVATGGIEEDPPSFAEPLLMQGGFEGEVNGFYNGGTRPISATALPIDDPNLSDYCTDVFSPDDAMYFQKPGSGAWIHRSDGTFADSMGFTAFNIGASSRAYTHWAWGFRADGYNGLDQFSTPDIVINISSTAITVNYGVQGGGSTTTTMAIPATAWIHMERFEVLGEPYPAGPFNGPPWAIPTQTFCKVWLNGVLVIDGSSFLSRYANLAINPTYEFTTVGATVDIVGDLQRLVELYCLSDLGHFDALKIAWDRNKNTYILPPECS